MGRNTSQSKVICASNTFSLYALALIDSMRPPVNLQSLNTEVR